MFMVVRGDRITVLRWCIAGILALADPRDACSAVRLRQPSAPARASSIGPEAEAADGSAGTGGSQHAEEAAIGQQDIVVLLDRGGCSFVQKASPSSGTWAAQRSSSVMVQAAFMDRKWMLHQQTHRCSSRGLQRVKPVRFCPFAGVECPGGGRQGRDCRQQRGWRAAGGHGRRRQRPPAGHSCFWHFGRRRHGSAVSCT